MTYEEQLSPGQIVSDANGTHVFRILWMNADQTEGYWILVNSKSNIPKKFHPNDLRQDIADGIMVYGADTWRLRLQYHSTSDAALASRNRAWECIKLLVEEEPEIYDRQKRAVLVNTAAKENQTSDVTIYKFLGKYWKRGMVADALLPDRGNTRQTVPSRVGRKKRAGAMGKPLTKEDKRNFSTAVRKYYTKKSKLTLSDTYKLMLKDFYSIRKEDGSLALLPPDECPSRNQFYYWHRTHKDILKETLTRNGKREYQLNSRAILGKTEMYLKGPGVVTQIDATIADISLVRKDDRNAIIGRPTLYFCMDAYSRMVTGMYISLDPPSWHSAVLAIINSSEDKVAFCKRYGIEITPEDWPCANIPSILVADRGEIDSHVADCLTNSLGITIENAPAYRADLKGVIEQHFHVQNAELSNDIPGRIHKDFRQRCTEDYRLKSTLDIDQFIAIVIRCVLHYNNFRLLQEFDRSAQMREMGILPIPRDLWNYGIRYQSGVQRTIDKEYLRYSLLLKHDASITERGISFNNLTYTCDLAEEKKWFDLARVDGRKKITIAYDPRDMAEIYFVPEKGAAPVACRLTERFRFYSGFHYTEVVASFEKDKDEFAAYQSIELNSEISLRDEIEKISTEAENKKPLVRPESKTKRLASIKENRKAEMEERIASSIDRKCDEENIKQPENQTEYEIQPEESDEFQNYDPIDKMLFAMLQKKKETKEEQENGKSEE